MLIVFDDIIVDMKTNKKSKPMIVELFMRRRKLNSLAVFCHGLI